MSLLDAIRADVALITGNTGGFAVPITFTAPDGTVYVIPGTCTKHHLGINREGVAVNTRTVSVSVSEAAFAAALYPLRNSAGEVSILKHRVSFIDARGLAYQGVIRETFPDEHIGLIVCILGDYK